MMLQLAALGITSSTVVTGAQEEEDSFVNILSIDPSDYRNVVLNIEIDTGDGKNGRLERDNFQIIENEVEKEIESFEFGSTKSDIVFVFDDSGSMGDEIDAMKSEVSDLVAEIEEADIDAQYGLVTFKDDYNVKLNLTEDGSRLQSEVDDLSASGGGDVPEDNFDSIARALGFDFRRDAQKVLIDITDAVSHYRGDGSGVSEYKIGEIADLLTESGVAYIAVSPGYSDEDAAKKVLADKVDGTWIDINSADFDVILEEITELVVSAYVIEYITGLNPGEAGQISVIVDDPEQGRERIDDEIQIPDDVVNAVITSIEDPPTGVEPDQPVTMSLEIKSESLDKEDIEVNADADISATWGIEGGTDGSESADITVTEPESGTFDVDIQFPSIKTIDPTTPSGGMVYDIAVDVPVVPEGSFDEGWRAYTFEQVDSLATVLAHSSNVGPNKTGSELYGFLRETAEFVCEYYASTLGSKGAHGFQFDFVTRETDNGWLELDGTRDSYIGEDDAYSREFVAEALDTAANELDVIFDDYTTAFVLNQRRLGRAFYMGELYPDGVDWIPIPFGGIIVLVPASVVTDRLPISPYRTPTGRIDAAYDAIEERAWRHELGHSLGSGIQIGLPDLYDMTTGNFGSIGEWGMMGTRSEGPFFSYCQVLGGDYVSDDEWLESSNEFHFLDSLTLELTPLTEQQLGDKANYLTSVFGEFTIDVDIRGTGPSVDFTPKNFHVTVYILEARKSGKFELDVGDPREDSRNKFDRSPSDDNGVQIYRFGLINIDTRTELEKVLEGERPIELDDFTLVDIRNIPPETGVESQPTLSLEKGSQYETYEDPNTATAFELEEPVSSGTASVRVQRNPESLVGSGAKYVTHIIGDLVDYFDEIADQVDGPLHAEESFPGLEILATTPDGRRVGIDPETGVRYEEIKGAKISGNRRSLMVSIPGDEEVTVTVSANRLREALEQRGIEPPDEIPYKRTTIVDESPSIRDLDGIPFIEGRTRQRVRTTTGSGSDRVLLPETVARFEPDRIDIFADKEFLTAKLAFNADVDLQSFVVESVTTDKVRAVHGDYDFVEDPTVDDEDVDVQVKFDRQKLAEAYDTGEHEIFITGLVDGVTFQASTTVELYIGCGWVDARTPGDVTVDGIVVECNLDGSDVHNLEIKNDGVVIGEIEADGNIDMYGGTTRSGDAASLNGGDVNLSEGSIINGALSASGNVNLDDSSHIHGDVTADGTVSVDSESGITGDVDTTGDVYVSDGSHIEGRIDADGDIDLGTGVTVGGKITAAGDIDISDDSTVETDVESTDNGSITVSNAAVQGNIATGGDVDIASSTVDNHVYQGAGFSCQSSMVNGLNCSEYTPKSYEAY
jgi:cytoskeletal protein CcmA (bactofilin family)/Mg-chelatase subunit ChlD